MGFVWVHNGPGSARFVDAKYLPPCNICGKQLDQCPKHEKENQDGQDGIVARGDDSSSNNNDN
jgi:hypothetical protein